MKKYKLISEHDLKKIKGGSSLWYPFRTKKIFRIKF